MTQYIDKDAVVAMIEKELQNLIACKENTSFTESKVVLWAKIDICKEILSFLDTIEVEDINIEKESELIANGIMIGVQANKYHTNVYNTKRNDFNHSHLCFAAKKGIELGLKARKGE